MSIDINTGDFSHFWDLVKLRTSHRLLKFFLSNCRLCQNRSLFSLKYFLTQKFKILRQFWSFWATMVICSLSGSKIRPTRWIFLFCKLPCKWHAKGKLLSKMPNENVLAIAPQGNLQLSPNYFWNFSHQGFLTIFWIFQTGLMHLCILYVDSIIVNQIQLFKKKWQDKDDVQFRRRPKCKNST